MSSPQPSPRPLLSVAPTTDAIPSPRKAVDVGDDNALAKPPQSIAAATTAALSDGAFAAVESEFAAVLSSLSNERSLERFRVEYEKLHAALRQSHVNESALINKCRQLNDEIIANGAKIASAVKLSVRDQSSLALLKGELESAWKMVESGNEKERKSKETISKLKGEMNALSKLVDESAGMTAGHETAMNLLMSTKEALALKVDEQSMMLEDSRHQIDELTAHIKQCDEDRSTSEKSLIAMKEKFAVEKAESTRQFRRAERLQSELLTLKEASARQIADAAEKAKAHSALSEQFAEIDTKLKSATAAASSFQTAADELKQRNEDCEVQLSQWRARERDLIGEIDTANVELKRLNRETKNKDIDISALHKKVSAIEKDKEQVVSSRNEADRYCNWLKDEMKVLLKSLESSKKDTEADEKTLKDLQLQMKRLTTTLHASVDKNAVQSQLVSEHATIKQSLEDDIYSAKVECDLLRKKVYQLEREKERADAKASGWYAKWHEIRDSVKLKDMELSEMQKAIDDERKKMKVQQNLYEQVRSDRNMFSAAQVEAEDEISEMKRKFKIMTHQIDQLKEEIGTKDSALISQHHSYKKCVEEMKMMKRKLAKRKEVLHKADHVLASQEAEIGQLRRAIQLAHQTQSAQKRQFEQVIAERDLLGVQLIRRNDELALIYEKVRIMEKTVKKGESMYGARLLDIKTLTNERNDLSRKCLILAESARGLNEVRTALFVSQKALRIEENKVRALSDDIENPMNVHRWRALEGADPKRFELIEKIQTLQKRLILVSEQCAEKDLMIAERDRLYSDLKALLARQPGPEVGSLISRWERDVRDKKRALQAMCAELNMSHAQIAELTYEKSRLCKEAASWKLKWMDMKSRQTTDRDGNEERKEQIGDGYFQTERLTATSSSVPKIVGGGFHLHVAAPT